MVKPVVKRMKRNKREKENMQQMQVMDHVLVETNQRSNVLEDHHLKFIHGSNGSIKPQISYPPLSVAFEDPDIGMLLQRTMDLEAELKVEKERQRIEVDPVLLQSQVANLDIREKQKQCSDSSMNHDLVQEWKNYVLSQMHQLDSALDKKIVDAWLHKLPIHEKPLIEPGIYTAYWKLQDDFEKLKQQSKVQATQHYSVSESLLEPNVSSTQSVETKHSKSSYNKPTRIITGVEKPTKRNMDRQPKAVAPKTRTHPRFKAVPNPWR